MRMFKRISPSPDPRPSVFRIKEIPIGSSLFRRSHPFI